MPNDGPTLFGPGGQPITNKIAYPLGGNVLELGAAPEVLFAQGFLARDGAGNPAGSLPNMILATWASAAVHFADHEQVIGAHGNHMYQLECRVSALERVLKKHRPEIHEEYVKEVQVVAEEFQQQALEQQRAAAQAAAPGHGPGDPS